MSRVKTQEELDREQQDAALARQLMAQEQAEFEAAQARRMAPPPPQSAPAHIQQQPPQSVLSVMCPVCMALNNINPANLHLAHMCGGCRRLLPNRAEQLNTAQRADLASAPPVQRAPAQTMLRCQSCRADNVVPPQGGAFRCGNCGQPLQSTISGAPQPVTAPAPYAPPAVQHQQHQQQQQPPPASYAQQPTTRTVIQAQAVDPPPPAAPRQLEVRCGRCPAVNSIAEDLRTPGVIQFKCGSCGALNRANY